MAKGGYIRIYSYMIEILGLSGNTLTVFALINSFTESNGSYNGSVQYIADWLGISRKSVERATKDLRERGLLRLTDGRYTAKSYAAIEAELSDGRTDTEVGTLPDSDCVGQGAEDKTSHATIFTDEPTKRPSQSDKRSHNNNTTYNNTLTTPSPQNASRWRGNGVLPKYLTQKIGYSQFVRMTPEQYESLKRLVDNTVLESYIMRMDKLLELPAKNGTVYVHSAYHTIKKWIEEDMSL
ncbi:MAG: helix-turn-helix domain-containing protein [Clostridia bacterium]|nr:helix-turn-helix domain-containing protein [Clostridia bacterium]